MLRQPTLDLLHTLRLTGMAAALEEQQGIPDIASLGFDERFALLLERENSTRENRRLTRLLQLARFRLSACVEDVNFRAKRGLDRSLVLRLASGEWIRQHNTLLIAGPTGRGKTYLACVLGHAACRQGLSVRCFRLPRLLGDLALARGDGSFGHLLQSLSKTDLVILDDWGLAPLADRERRDLLEVIEDRSDRRSTLVTSQIPVDHRHDLVGDGDLAEAILDRLLERGADFEIRGRSYRTRHLKADDLPRPEGGE